MDLSNKIKVLHLSAVKNWGGGENHIEALYTEGKQLGENVEHTIFCVRRGDFQKKLKEKNISHISSPLIFKLDPLFAFKLLHTCRKKEIDLLHIHDSTALALAVMADKFGNLPSMVFSKKTSFPIKDRKQTLFKYNYPKIKKIFCVSEETRRITAEKITDPGKLTTIYHGVNLGNQKERGKFSIREKLNLGNDKTLIGNIGNHIRAKHLETWIGVVHQIVNVQERKNFFFVQMGVFTDRTKALKQKVKELGLEDHVAFMGFVPEASNLITQFDITLVTSQSEGLPGVIYESFYHKTPVVSTNVGGIPEVIEHGVNGLLADMHDPQTLSKHILNLHDKPQLIKKYTELSRKKLEEAYTSKVMARRTIEEYKKILHGRS